MSDGQSITAHLLESWSARAGTSLNGTLHDHRVKAMDRFKASGIPARRTESWKYTPISAILDRLPALNLDASKLGQATDEQVSALALQGLEGDRVVLVDGRFRADLSDLSGLPFGVRVMDLSEATADPVVLAHLDRSGDTARDSFVELNSAFVNDGVFIHVAEGVSSDRPLVIQHVTSASVPSMVQPRILGVFEKGCTCHLVEVCRSVGSAPVFTNSVSEYFTSSGAVVDHVRLIDEHEAAIHINNLRSYQSGDSSFGTIVVTLSKGVVRNQSYFLPDGENCHTHLNGFYLAQGNAHIDISTFVDHAKPECESNELFKGILSGKGVGVFNGKVLVRQDAQRINAYQSNKSVILDDSARVYSKPELEIYADDVKCSHGATMGELDKEAMFYLESRGIRPQQARLMLLEAFASDALDLIALEPVRAHVDEIIRARLGAN